ncbi:MAG: four helix bundle protein [Bacteroidaceae bacterium]|nr:four helix bundle protein [Bacteroidaceae bacterium]
MALSESLPVYRQSYELLQHILLLVPKLPRIYRFNVGQRLIDSALDVLSLIYEANASRDKVQPLTRLARQYEMTTMLLRVLYDTHVIGAKQAAFFIQLTTGIGRQITAWKNHYLSVPHTNDKNPRRTADDTPGN